MKQQVDVLAKFNIGRTLPIPLRFKMLEGGSRLAIDVYSILGMEYIGTNRVDFSCNSLSSRGNLLNYTLSYYKKEGKWLFLSNDEAKLEHTVKPI